MTDSRGRGGGGPEPDHAGSHWWDSSRPRVDAERERQVELALMIEAAGFDPDDPGVREVVRMLEDVCMGTLVNMRAKGTLFREVRSLGMWTLPPVPANWATHCHEVFTETSVTAARRFVMKKIIDWIPEQASMITYFINYGLFTFKPIYKAFCDQAAETDRLVLTESDNVHQLFKNDCQQPALEDQVIDRMVMVETLTLMEDPRLAEIVVLLVQGKTKAQVSRELNISPATVYRAIAAFRDKLGDNGFQGRSK